MVQFLASLHSDHFSEESEQRRCHRVATFDVDGPCDVITPFDSELERLPRPVFRSNSQCWVVEHMGGRVVEGKESNGPDALSEQQRTDAEMESNQQSLPAFSDSGRVLPDASSQHVVETVIDSNSAESTTVRFERPQASEDQLSEHRPKPSSTPHPEESPDTEDENKSETLRNKPAKVRVLRRKVRRAWDIMDPTLHSWTFV
jgi:hypothetical protein